MAERASSLLCPSVCVIFLFFIASSFLLLFLVIPQKQKEVFFFSLKRKLGCSVITGKGAKGETEAETVNTASDSQSKRLDNRMEPATDMESFGSPPGAEWGPTMVA